MSILRRTLLAAVGAAVCLVQCAPAQAETGPVVLRDTEAETVLAQIAAPLARSAGLARGDLKIVILQDPEINAFVNGGQTIYVNSGLLLAADDANQIEGVLAHELGHIEGGHIANMGQGMKPAGRIAVLSAVAAVGAMAMGAGDAGLAMLAAGGQTAERKILAFDRTQEGSADASAVRHLNEAHLSGKGMIEFLAKLRKEEWRLSSSTSAIDPYAQTHPMSADREDMLRRDLERSPWWNAPGDPKLDAAYARIKAKLAGYVLDQQTIASRYPASDQSEPARYARAYAWHRAAWPDKAEAEIAPLLAAHPQDPWYQELHGQMLLEDGHPKEAVAAFRVASAASDHAPLIDAALGQALVACDDDRLLAEAEQALRSSVTRDRLDPDAWQALGTVWTRQGDEGRARLAYAETQAANGQTQLAASFARQAMDSIPKGSADWLRAQDVSFVNGD